MPELGTMGEHFRRFIERLIQQRRYETLSEIAREALSLLEEEQNQDLALELLRHDIRIGVASGEGKPAEEVQDRLQAEVSSHGRLRQTRGVSLTFTPSSP